MARCVNGTSVKERKRITRKVTDVTLKNLLGARVKGAAVSLGLLLGNFIGKQNQK